MEGKRLEQKKLLGGAQLEEKEEDWCKCDTTKG